MISKALIAASTKPIILSVLLAGEDYGYHIIQRVKQISGGSLAWSDRMLYPVLRRMEEEALLLSRWVMFEEGKMRRYYRITEKGRQELDRERRQWRSVVQALSTLWKPLPSLD